MQKRKGMTSVKKPEPDVELQLDRELNDTDIYVVSFGSKDVVGSKPTIEKMKGKGIVKMRFINKNGRNVEHYETNSNN